MGHVRRRDPTLAGEVDRSQRDDGLGDPLDEREGRRASHLAADVANTLHVAAHQLEEPIEEHDERLPLDPDSRIDERRGVEPERTDELLAADPMPSAASNRFTAILYVRRIPVLGPISAKPSSTR